jgi:putative aldouronate transport system substrate-binding protein
MTLMNTTTQLSQVGDFSLERRSFLRMIAAGAAVVGVPSLLSGCATEPPTTDAAVGGSVDGLIPKYLPVSYVKPDFPGVRGSIPGFITWPKELVQSVKTVPGSGSTFKAMVPLWGTLPTTNGNRYYQAVNDMLGSKLEFELTDGNTYADKLATVLASPKDVPDWVSVPAWTLPPRFGAEIVGNVFEDLTPFLAGDKIKDYPNLANIPSDSWKFCVFNGKLYGLPYPTGILSDATFYRDDVLKQLGIKPDVKNGDDMLALAKELTDPKAGRWGADDLWTTAQLMYAIPLKWKLDGTKLVHRFESAEYRAALAWNAKLFASGSVHPDAVSGKIAESGIRFQSGKTLIIAGGLGAWDPTYSMKPFLPFAADGGKPVLFKPNPANIFSFLKKSDDKAKITEMLKLANLMAAPFGTTEYNLIQHGVEGVHYTKDATTGFPVPTPLAAKELQASYIFLVDGPIGETQARFPQFVKDECVWQAACSEFVTDPLFFSQQITEPLHFGSLAQPFDDLEKDIARGRKTLKDLDEAIATWKSSGGDELRTFYQKILDKH